MKICYIITDLDFGGAERQLVDIAIRMRSKGHVVSIISMLKPVAFVEELSKGGVDIYTLNMVRGKAKFNDYIDAIKIIRNINPEIIHSHMVHANILSRLLKPLTGFKKTICTAHNTNEGGYILDFAYKLTDFLSDINTQVSHQGLNRYINEKIFRKKYNSFYMPNGVSLSKFRTDTKGRVTVRKELSIDDDVFLWVAIGRIEDQKNYPLLIDSFKKIVNTNPNNKLIIVGKGYLSVEIEKLIESNGLQDSIKMLGLRTDICDILNASDAYIMSSSWEGMPIVILEASAVGLPIVSTDVGGIKDIIGDFGFFCEQDNSEALAQTALLVSKKSKDELTHLGECLKNHVRENFDIDNIVNRWICIYQS